MLHSLPYTSLQQYGCFANLSKLFEEEHCSRSNSVEIEINFGAGGDGVDNHSRQELNMLKISHIMSSGYIQHIKDIYVTSPVIFGDT